MHNHYLVKLHMLMYQQASSQICKRIVFKLVTEMQQSIY